MRLLVLITLIMNLIVMPAAEAAVHTVPLSSIGYANDLTVTGAQTATNLTFPLPKADLQNPSTINLVLEPSPYLNGNSTFSIFLNDKPAATLSAAQLKAKPDIQLPFPYGAALERAVRVTIKTNMYVTDDICADWRRGHLFYTLRNRSNATFNFIPPSPKTIPDFFASFYQGAVIVIPDKPTIGELTAGSWTFAALQKLYPYQQIRFVTAAEQAAIPAAVPRIWVALRNHLPLPLTQSQANIYLPHPNTLIATSDNEDHLKETAQQLVTVPVQAALPTAKSLVSLDQSNQQGSEKNEQIAFGNNSVQEGIGVVAMDFPIYPGLFNAAPRSLGLHLEGRYSPNTVTSRPVRLDVFMNRNLIYSEALDNSGVLNKDITLPGTLALKTKNLLSVEFRYPEETGQCGVKGPLQTAQIHYSSYYVGLRSFAADNLTWDNIGLLFTKNGLILIDDQLTPDIIKAAGYIALFINNQLPEGSFVFPEFRPLSAWQEPHKAAYLSVLAPAGRVPEELLMNSNLKSREDSTIFQSQSKAAFYRYDPTVNNVTGHISQYKGVPVMVFAAHMNTTRLPLALQHLADPKNGPKLHGDVYVYGDSISFHATKPKDMTLGDAVQSGFSLLNLPWNFWEQVKRFVAEYYRYMAIGLLIIAALLVGRTISPYRGKRTR